MRPVRFVLALVLACSGVAAACSTSDKVDDEPGSGGRILPPSGGGQGGSGGQAGAGQAGSGQAGSGQAGSSGNQGGQAGASGSAGAAGSAGGSTGGAAGGGGSAGQGQGGAPPLGPDDFVIDTYNVALAGAFIPYEAERRPAVEAAVAAMDSDIVCLQEVWQQSDKDAIAAAAKAKFPSIVSFKHDLNTPVDDPTDASGQVPPAPTTPPCGADMVKTAFEKGLTCLVNNCSTMPGNDAGQAVSSSCASMKCLPDAAALLTSGPDYTRCYGCLAPLLPASSFADIKQQCENEKNGGLAFGGQNGVMLLSKHPLSNVEVRVLPGTWNRRVIVRATASLKNGAEVDVYCNHLSPIFDGFIYPYTGQYGAGSMTQKDNWAAEQLLQAQKLLTYVGEKSGSKRAIVVGDFNASPEVKDSSGKVIVNPDGVATLKALTDGGLVEAVSSGYQPTCTYCRENNNVADDDTGAPEWIDHIFLKGIDASATTYTTLTFTDAVVAAKDDKGNDVKTQVSDHYGLRSFVTIKP